MCVDVCEQRLEVALCLKADDDVMVDFAGEKDETAVLDTALPALLLKRILVDNANRNCGFA